MSAGARTITVVWSLAAFVVTVALAAALVVVVRDPSGERAARWALALFFLGGPVVWTSRSRSRRFRRFSRR